MSKDKISDYSATANSNTDIGGINIDEGCAPSGINDAIRTLMKQLKDFQQGTNSDSFNGPVGSTTRSTGAFTSLSTTGDITIDNGSADGGQLLLASSGYSNWGIDNYSGNFRWYYNTTEKMRLDNSGNLGLGVTPSAWWSGIFLSFDVGSTSSLWNSTGSTNLSDNLYYSSGGLKYKTTAAATRYQQNAGQHIWFNVPSGTANTTATATQAMTLDASGNLLVGATSALLSSSGRGNITLNGSSDAIISFGIAGTNSGYIYNSASVLEINAPGSRYIQFTTNGSERARIDSSGVLLLGTTSAGATPSALLQIGGTSTSSRVLPRTDNTGYVGDSGQRWQAVYAVNGTIQTSDGREKNTIQDSNLGLSFINSLRPVSYKWNVGENVVTYDEEGNEIVTPRAGARTHYGFIAQEVQAAIPSGVDFGGFVQEPNDGPMSLRYHEFIGPLVKAIQEQQAIIESLTARIEALEA